MPFNPGNYVFQPRPLQQFDFGQGSRDVIQARQNRQRLENQSRQFDQTRSDNQAQFSAEFAKTQGDAQHTAAAGRHAEQVKLVNAATQAAQGGDWNTARALVPRILELGGEAAESGDPNSPDFRFKAGAAPQRAPLDFGGARRGIYGQQGPSVSAPFQMPGIGPNAQKNPFTPPAIPGASAAQLPPPPATSSPPVDAAGPPPGAAIDGPRTPPPGAVWLPPEAPPSDTNAMNQGPAPAGTLAENQTVSSSGQQGQPDSPQEGPNPFDPYAISSAKVRASNEARLDPVLTGIMQATPSRFRSQIQQYNEGLRALNLPPAQTLELMKDYYKELMGSYRGEVAAEGQAGRLAQMGRHQESVQADKDREQGFRRAREIANSESLKATKDKLKLAAGIEGNLERAHLNGAAANALIRQVYSMYAGGVMTDRDYDDTKEGVRTIFNAFANKTFEKVFNPHGGGLAPNIVDDMREVVEIALKNHRKSASSASDALYRAYKNTKNRDEQDAIREYLESGVTEEYYPEEFKQGYADAAGGIPEHDPEDEEQILQNLRNGGSLGVVPLPKEPNRAGAVRGSRVPAKPPRKRPGEVAPKYEGKDPGTMSPEEMKAKLEEIKRKMETQ